MNYGSVDRKNNFFHELELIKMLFVFLTKSRFALIRKAKKEISELDITDNEKKKILKLYKRDYDKYRCRFDEFYHGYKFLELSDAQKKEFLSNKDFQMIERKYKLFYPDQWKITTDKVRFLKEYSKFVHREWMLVDSASNVMEVQHFLDRFDVIAKPLDAERGIGVYKIYRGSGNAQELLNGKLPILLEECIYNADSISEFHPASLNTVRVVTISNGKEAKLLGACIRTGNNNSVFDNAFGGGLYAEIDLETGIIVSNGVTEKGLDVEIHPMSGKKFKGFKIPKWDELIKVCKDIALYNPNTTIIGWDVAITPNGIEIIEGNSLPAIEGHQWPLHKGIRKRVFSIMDDLGLQYRDIMFLGAILGRLSKYVYYGVQFRNFVRNKRN